MAPLGHHKEVKKWKIAQSVLISSKQNKYKIKSQYYCIEYFFGKMYFCFICISLVSSPKKSSLKVPQKFLKEMYSDYLQKQPPEVKKGVFKNFANFIGKDLCWSLILIKLQAFRPPILLKRDSNTVAFL